MRVSTILAGLTIVIAGAYVLDAIQMINAHKDYIERQRIAAIDKDIEIGILRMRLSRAEGRNLLLQEVERSARLAANNRATLENFLLESLRSKSPALCAPRVSESKLRQLLEEEQGKKEAAQKEVRQLLDTQLAALDLITRLREDNLFLELTLQSIEPCRKRRASLVPAHEPGFLHC